MKIMAIGLACLLASPFASAAYENEFCFSGEKQTFSYQENISAGAAQFTGSWRTTPPGGVMDGATSECMGSFSTQDGKYVATGHCKTVGDGKSAYFSEYLREGKNGKQKVLSATGKFTSRIGIPTAYTAQGNYPQLPGKVVGCVTSVSRD